jgi:16S rRNA (cytosine967-C5)-methyltransferase
MPGPDPQEHGYATIPRAAGVTDARMVAAEICGDLRRGELLDASFDRRALPLDSRDRRWTRELMYGMLRARGRIDALLTERVRGGIGRLDRELLDLLRLGVYQLLHMGSVPPYAAIAQTVELAKQRVGEGAGKLANAVLRRLDRERDALALPHSSDPVEALALEYSHPRWLVARWLERWGEDDTRRLLACNNAEAPIVVRPYHIVREQLEAMFDAAGVRVTDAPLVSDSLLLTSAISGLTELGAFRQGLFFVQDPASTLVTKYASFPDGAAVADVCSAPGGKAMELARTAGAVFVSDSSRSRLRRVIENIRRLECATVYPYVADMTAPAIRPIGNVLLDAPCTGTGTMRRHPDARWRLKPSDLAVLPSLQRDLLRAAATIVAPGGLLVYSTCSLEAEENEDQVDRFLAEHPTWRLEPPPEGAIPAIALSSGYLRVLPQRHGTDGAFAARLRRAA